MTDAEKIKQVREILKALTFEHDVDAAIGKLKALGLVIKSDDQEWPKGSESQQKERRENTAYFRGWWQGSDAADEAGFVRIIELEKKDGST